jgi:hypothetical protein
MVKVPDDNTLILVLRLLFLARGALLADSNCHLDFLLLCRVLVTRVKVEHVRARFLAREELCCVDNHHSHPMCISSDVKKKKYMAIFHHASRMTKFVGFTYKLIGNTM